MKTILPVLVLILTTGSFAFAQTYRGGYIIYQNTGYLTYQATVYTYTNNIYVPPDVDTITVNWGDGTTSLAPRINGDGQNLGNNVKVNIYQTPPHTYPGPQPFHIVSIEEPNRLDGILNINDGNSGDIPLYVEDTLYLNNPCNTGYANSPILLNTQLAFANVSDTFRFNPGAWDGSGDSLSYQFAPNLQASGMPVPAESFPTEVDPGIDNIMTIDSVTGEIIWATPQEQGPYSIAVLITIFRNGVEQGTVLVDMMIIVNDEDDAPPIIAAVHDTCVMAGALLNMTVDATDTISTETVTLSAVGGPLSDSNAVGSVANFTSTPSTGSVSGNFSWQTNCQAVREQPYQFVFTAQDNYAMAPLFSATAWNVRVIAPSPENLTAVSSGDSVVLTWDSNYACNNMQTPGFQGFSVWLSIGSANYTLDTCTPGLSGWYLPITNGLYINYYVDTEHVNGDYCYRVEADFADTTTCGYPVNTAYSLPTSEACATITTGINLFESVRGMTVYPNPAMDVLNIHEQEEGDYQVQILDLLGRTMMEQTFSGDASMNISTLAKGMYLVRYTLNGNTGTTKISIE